VDDNWDTGVSTTHHTTIISSRPLVGAQTSVALSDC